MKYRSRRWLIFFVIALLVVGCGRTTPTPMSTPTETMATEAPTSTLDANPTPANPTAAVSPASGPPGTEVQVTGTGFPPGTEIDLGVGPQGGVDELMISLWTDAAGHLAKKLAIPASAEPGESWVVTAMTKDGALQADSNVFEVTQAQYEGAGRDLAEQRAAQHALWSIIAEGFPSNTVVEIGVGRVDSEYDVIATAETDADGRAETQITMPAFVEPGDPYVIVVADESRPIKAVSDVFDVTTGPTPTPSGEDGKWEDDLFTRTNIYLVAIGDEGESGEEFGCGDSLVPVEVEIEPTIAPMTAAFEELLAIDTKEYGQSGLYSALYRSDLTVEGIDIEDREAIINLTGELVVGGTCDTPRVEVQLRQTALQYSTVDEVSIFINGEPLDEVLSQQG